MHCQIRLFGAFEIVQNGKRVSQPIEHSKKLCGLIEYLILHRLRAVPVQELLDVFWNGDQGASPHNALKMLVHRLRVSLREGGLLEASIITARGSVRFAPSCGAQVDTETFETLCEKAAANPEQTEYADEAIALYRGPFLANTVDPAPWICAEADRLHTIFLQTFETRLCQLQEQQDFDGAVALCERVLATLPYDEDINRLLILTLIACNRRQEALATYNHITGALYNELGRQASPALLETYRLIGETAESETDIDALRAMLQEKEPSDGAFFCEYEIFKDLYRLQMRCLERYDGQLHLGLLTATDEKLGELDVRVLRRAMDWLLEAAQDSLRRGDVIARYSPAQYVILLPAVTYETGTMVLKRIIRTFRRNHPGSAATVSYKLRSLNNK